MSNSFYLLWTTTHVQRGDDQHSTADSEVLLEGTPFTHANRRPPMGGRGRCLTIKPSYAVIRRADADTEAKAAIGQPVRHGCRCIEGVAVLWVAEKRASKSGNNI